MKSYLSSQLEVRAAKAGELSRLFVPVKSAINSIHTEGNPVKLLGDWPLSGYEGESGGLHIFNIQTAADDYRTERIRPPYPPESLIYFREAFTVLEPEHCAGPKERFAYMADTPKGSEGDSCRLDYIKSGWPYQWIPGSRMPREAARIYATLGEPTVEQVDGIWKWAYPVTVISTTGKP